MIALVALLLFIVFTAGYAFLSWSVMYHLSQFSILGSLKPRFISLLFILSAGFFWLYTAYFLLQIPSY